MEIIEYLVYFAMVITCSVTSPIPSTGDSHPHEAAMTIKPTIANKSSKSNSSKLRNDNRPSLHRADIAEEDPILESKKRHLIANALCDDITESSRTSIGRSQNNKLTSLSSMHAKHNLQKKSNSSVKVSKTSNSRNSSKSSKSNSSPSGSGKHINQNALLDIKENTAASKGPIVIVVKVYGFTPDSSMSHNSKAALPDSGKHIQQNTLATTARSTNTLITPSLKINTENSRPETTQYSGSTSNSGEFSSGSSKNKKTTGFSSTENIQQFEDSSESIDASFNTFSDYLPVVHNKTLLTHILESIGTTLGLSSPSIPSSAGENFLNLTYSSLSNTSSASKYGKLTKFFLNFIRTILNAASKDKNALQLIHNDINKWLTKITSHSRLMKLFMKTIERIRSVFNSFRHWKEKAYSRLSDYFNRIMPLGWYS